MNLDVILNQFWAIQIIFLLLGGLIIAYLENKLHKKFFPHIKHTKTIWDEAFFYALHKPFNIFIWVVVLAISSDILSEHIEGLDLFRFTHKASKILILALVVWLVMRFITYAEKIMIARKSSKPQGIDITTLHAVCQLIRTIIIALSVLTGLQILGVPLSAIWAFGGMGGLAVGFAAKDTLANFFGGFMIYIDRPFIVGNWIRSPDKEIEGTVEHIGWRLTHIRTFDKRLLYIPNSVFSTIGIENPSRMTNRRIKAIINLRYDDAGKVATILQDIEDMLRSHPDIDAEQTLMVNLIECASWSLDFMLYAFTKTTEWVTFQKVQQDVLLKMLEIVAKHKAECAFPTSTIHVPEPIHMQQ